MRWKILPLARVPPSRKTHPGAPFGLGCEPRYTGQYVDPPQNLFEHCRRSGDLASMPAAASTLPSPSDPLL
jgi:hypothetical protein